MISVFKRIANFLVGYVKDLMVKYENCNKLIIKEFCYYVEVCFIHYFGFDFV